jgi:hypothetical protein
MPRQRTALEYAARKLISSIQKEWSAEAAEPQSKESEAVVDRAHLLLQAAKASELRSCAKAKTPPHSRYRSWLVFVPKAKFARKCDITTMTIRNYLRERVERAAAVSEAHAEAIVQTAAPPKMRAAPTKD